MKIKFFSFCIFILMSLYTVAQNPVIIGSSFEVPKYGYVSKILGEVGDKIYVERADENIYIDVFDTKLNRISATPINLKSGEVQLKLYHISLIGDKIFLAASGYDEQQKTRIFLGSMMPATATSYNPTWQKLISVSNVDKYELNLNFYVSLSSGGNRILVVQENKIDEINFPTLFVFNNSLELVYQKELKNLNYRKYYSFVDDDENVHIVGSDGGKKTDVYSYYRSEDLIKHHEINIGENFLGALYFTTAEKGKFCIGAVYASNKTRDLDGLSVITINSLTKQVDVIQKPFPKEFLKKYLSDKDIGKGAGLSDFRIIDFEIMDNADAIFVCEQYSYVRSAVEDERVHYWNYDNVFVARINEDDSRIAFVNVPKAQEGSKGTHRDIDFGRLSKFYERFGAASVITDNQVKVFYNDHPANLNVEGGKLKKLGRNGNVIPCIKTVDFTGTTATKVVNDNAGSKKSELQFIPRVYKSFPDGHLLIVGSKEDGQYCLIRY